MIDDYGHHPAEIQATLSAVRESWSRPLTVIFQPHRYSRTRDLFEDFLRSFDGVDRLILTDIYGAGEDPIAGIDADGLYRAMKRRGHLEIHYIPEKTQVAKWLLPKLNSGDLVLTLGAGDVYKVGEELLEWLQR